MHLLIPSRSAHLRLTKLALAAALALPLALHAQQTQPPPPATDPQTPHGQVLFEGHSTDAIVDTPPPAAEEPAPPASRPGISSSQKRGQAATLRRRADADTSTSDPQPTTADPQVSSSEQSEPTDEPQPNAPVLITPADREAASHVTAADRSAIAISATDLDLHLNTHTGETEARAQLTVRNTSTAPLQQILLRISGALTWESAHATATALKLTQYRVPDDLDHTGIATELALTLPQPLGPGATLPLELFYGGHLGESAQRLLNLGAPNERAIRTDWDTVSDTFTGLRGLGNVLWYPVSEPPATLRDGSVPQTVAQSRIRNAGTPFHLSLTVQYIGAPPEAAYFCGDRKRLAPLSPNEKSFESELGAVIAEWNRPILGPHTPSLFVAQAAPQEAASGLVRVVTDRPDTSAALGEAAARLRPMLSDWLGARPLRPLDVLDLPIPGATGFADGAFLVAPLNTAPAASLAPSLVGPLTAAWLPADLTAPWLREGLPVFLQSIWAARAGGREAALNGLAASRTSLTQIAATSSVSSSSSDDAPPPTLSGPPLSTCADPACARGKGAYVFEMLRTMLGDSALQQAISGWRLAQETARNHAPTAETASLESLLQQVAGKRDLTWFFQSWIDANHGLPELSIVTVAPRRVERNAPTNYLPKKEAVGGPIGAEPVPLPGDPESVAPRSGTPGNRIAPAAGSWLVAVEVQNAGDADAEVPVTVRAGGLTNTLPLRVPAHGRATIRVPFEADPQEVLVNDGSVPEMRTSQHRRTINALNR